MKTTTEIYTIEKNGQIFTMVKGLKSDLDLSRVMTLCRKEIKGKYSDGFVDTTNELIGFRGNVKEKVLDFLIKNDCY